MADWFRQRDRIPQQRFTFPYAAQVRRRERHVEEFGLAPEIARSLEPPHCLAAAFLGFPHARQYVFDVHWPLGVVRESTARRGSCL